MGSMHTTGNPTLASSRTSQGVIDPPQRCNALDNASGCVSTTPPHAILPASSTTHTAARLKPTFSPSPAERVAFPPESSNLMYRLVMVPHYQVRHVKLFGD